MVRRVSSSQLRSELQRAQSQARQRQAKLRKAVNNYNTAARRANRTIEKYNNDARTHNARVRANRDRLRRELARLGRSSATSTTVVTYRTSVVRLQRSFERLDNSTLLRDDLLDLSEGETANSVAALNALLAEHDEQDATDDEVAELQRTEITTELSSFDPDMDARWRGALFALHPRNPDAARHFCTSVREMLSRVLERVAPDEVVVAVDPSCDRTPQGSVTRRARIRYCLARAGVVDPDFEDFVEADIDDVLSLFEEFNEGTHGEAGRFGLRQLSALKRRVEGAIVFLHRVAI